jgi:hypothetical protein
MNGLGRVMLAGAVLAAALVPVSGAGQSPDPSAAAIRLRPADTAQDETFRLEIRVDGSEFIEDGPPVQVDTWLAYVGDEQRITVSHAFGGIVAFGVRQLDGPFDPGGPGRRMSLQFDDWTVGEARQVPFAKSGGFSADDPLADAYQAWFDDPMLHLAPGTYEITAQAEYGPLGAPASQTLEASVIVKVAPGPSERPFTAPLVPRPLQNPDLATRWVPDGPPVAAVTRHGLRYELWLSADALAPGDWLQVAVKATNTTDRPIWQFADGCGAYGSLASATAIRRPAGETWTGKAAAFKQRAMRVGGASPAVELQRVGLPAAWVERGVQLAVLAECGGTVAPPVVRLGPGSSRIERFVGYAGAGVDHTPRFAEPLTPGEITVSLAWPYAGRGARPTWTYEDTFPAPIKASAPVRLTGDGPTTPPLGALVDTALADPRFRAWVDAHPDGTGWEVYVSRWPGPSYVNPRWASVRERAIFGMTELSLYHSGHGAHALFDTWTGELLDVVFS